MVLELVSPTFPIAIGIVGSWSNSEADFGFLLTPILGRIQVKIYISSKSLFSADLNSTVLHSAKFFHIPLFKWHTLVGKFFYY